MIGQNRSGNDFLVTSIGSLDDDFLGH